MQNVLSEPIFCCVTDGGGLPPPERALRVVEGVRHALSAGANWIQIREKQLETRALIALTREIVSIAAAQFAAQANRTLRVIVNDRADVALAAGAGGVHLGGRSVFAGEVAKWVGRHGAGFDFLIGVSCHSVSEARKAEAAGASYVIFGPVYRTPSKLGFGAPHGVARLAEACQAVKIPVIAIGGVEAGNAGACFTAGAAGVAAIRMFQEAGDAARAAELKRRLGAASAKASERGGDRRIAS